MNTNQENIINELLVESVKVRSGSISQSASKLGVLTEQLINERISHIRHDPLSTARERTLPVDTKELDKVLTGKTVLVTGASGCIASFLLSELTKFNVKKVVMIDIQAQHKRQVSSVNFQFYKIDVRSLEALHEVFISEKPEVVFHLAAIRVPAIAEAHTHDAFSTNIIGTSNIIKLCEEFKIEYCIFSSTGKCAQYTTRHVYSASKKICEYILDDANNTGHVKYGATRFTHVLDNSWINYVIDQGIEQGVVELHAPDRPMNVQNARQAAQLLLNSLLLTEKPSLKFSVVRDLGWPIELIDIALHKIYLSRKTVPIVFTGVPEGYDEHVFIGQIDISGDHDDINPLINALEAPTMSIDNSKTILAANLAGKYQPRHTQIISEVIGTILSTKPTRDKNEIKNYIAHQLGELVYTSFLKVDPILLLNSLTWGVIDNPTYSYAVHRDEIELLLRSLYNRLDYIDTKRFSYAHKLLAKLSLPLERIPFCHVEARYLRDFVLGGVSGREQMATE